jgi:hypothetical protein
VSKLPDALHRTGSAESEDKITEKTKSGAVGCNRPRPLTRPHGHSYEKTKDVYYAV